MAIRIMEKEKVIMSEGLVPLWEQYAPWYKKTFGKIGVFRGFAKKLKKFLLPAPGGTVLDAGCGPGLHFKSIIKTVKPFSLVGLDVSFSMLEEAKSVKERLASHNICQITLKHADLCEGIPFPDETFDVQLFQLVLYYMPTGEWKNVLVEAFRTTKPGGYIITTNVLKRFDFKQELGPLLLFKEMFCHFLSIVRLMKHVKPILTAFQALGEKGVIGYPSEEGMINFLYRIGFRNIETRFVWKDNTLMIRAHKPR